MGSDVKLLGLLSKLIEELQPLSLAWFSSFNLDPYLVETFMLPQLLGQERPRDIYDYEALSIRLAEAQEEGDLDARFFCDARVLQTSRLKRTTVPIHGVLPGSFGSKFQGGVFHPKVWYLQSNGENGEPRAYLVTASANLTVPGWATNRESVLVREVRDQANRSAIQEFWRECLSAGGVDGAPVHRIEDVPTDQEVAEWGFCWSGGPMEFTEALFAGGEGDSGPLSVWSPYWAHDPGRLMEAISERTGRSLDFHLYPDLIEGRRARMTEHQRDKLIASPWKEAARFFKEPGNNSDRFTHAKVWLLGQTMAVGSWNFTEAALGLAERANNIEAGIVSREGEPQGLLPSDTEEIALEELASSEPSESEEAPGLDYEFPPVVVEFDWIERQYRVKRLLTHGSGNRYYIKLPGLGEQLIPEARESTFPLSATDVSNLVHSRLCTVYQRGPDSRKEWHIYVFETGLSARQSMRYRDLDHLIAALQSGSDRSDASSGDWMVLNASSEQRFLADEQAILDSEQDREQDRSSTYFSLFRAFLVRRQQIAEANGARLRDFAERMPGNLFEIKEHMEENSEESDGKAGSPVYRYFLRRELLVLCNATVLRAQELPAGEIGENTAWIEEVRELSGEIEEWLRDERNLPADERESEICRALEREVYGT